LTDKQIHTIVEAYLKKHPSERQTLQLFLYQLENNDVMNDRKTLPGHITGCALVLSPDKTKLLLIYHKLFDIWLQPGGHWDPGESDPLHAAQREAEEETSVAIDRYLPIDPRNPLMPIHIESHAIAARPEKSELPHMHHDFTYVFIAKSAKNEDLNHLESEVMDAQWFALDAPECFWVRGRIKKLLDSSLI
jgi:8-oxo-dGTP pyrophosphatase MutT (NUDIX family)